MSVQSEDELVDLADQNFVKVVILGEPGSGKKCIRDRFDKLPKPTRPMNRLQFVVRESSDGGLVAGLAMQESGQIVYCVDVTSAAAFEKMHKQFGEYGRFCRSFNIPRPVMVLATKCDYDHSVYEDVTRVRDFPFSGTEKTFRAYYRHHVERVTRKMRMRVPPELASLIADFVPCQTTPNRILSREAILSCLRDIERQYGDALFIEYAEIGMPNAEFCQPSIEDIVLHMQRRAPVEYPPHGGSPSPPTTGAYAFRRSSSNRFQLPPPPPVSSVLPSPSPAARLPSAGVIDGSHSASHSLSRGRSLRRALSGLLPKFGGSHHSSSEKYPEPR